MVAPARCCCNPLYLRGRSDAPSTRRGRRLCATRGDRRVPDRRRSWPRNGRGCMLEVWLASVHVPRTAVAYGQQIEAEGFDGISFGDTQNIAADPFAGLSLAAAHTDRLGLMVGVTNP